jgi:hypothetical protein
MVIVRYADDIVVGLEHESVARRFCDAMRKRLESFLLPSCSAVKWVTGRLRGRAANYFSL